MRNPADFFLMYLFIFIRSLVLPTICYIFGELAHSNGGATAPVVFLSILLLIILCLLVFPADDIHSYNITELTITTITCILLFGGLSLLITVKRQIKN